MEELSTVRVVKLNTSDRHFDGTEEVKRPPRVGDTGTVVHKAGGLHIVESVDGDGLTIWLADFTSDELEEMKRSSSRTTGESIWTNGSIR